MKKKPEQRPYYRTAALLGAQQQPYGGRARRSASARTADLRLHIPWKFIALFTLIGTAVLWLLVDNNWYLMGEDIRVIGASSHETAVNVAMASDLLGWHGLRLRPRAATAAITEQVPAITEAQVECNRFPAECVIRVQEREPVLNWVAEDTVESNSEASATSEALATSDASLTGIYWIDAEGVLLPANEVRTELPVVRGPLPDLEEGANSRVRVAVLDGVTALAALGITADANGNGLEYHPERGLIWTDPQGRRVAFGVGANMEARWNIYVALIAHLEARTAAGDGVFPWTIDVRFPEGPTYSLERLW
ncbi:MAG: cell division protein FtsQ/DivIB [Anaerolineae bacterium]